MPFIISICDDEVGQLKYLSDLLIKWSKNRNIMISIKKYMSAEAFLFSYPDEPCSLLLLDIEMGELNGMELAKKLREKGDMLPLLFITGYSEYMNEGYEVDALHYLMKPVNEEKLFSVLDRYIMRNPADKSILLDCADGIVRVSLDDILYCEADKKNCLINLKKGEQLVCLSGISSLREKLGDDFILCHRSYVVNIRYVKSITKTDAILDGEKTIPISRRLYESVNKRFIEFFTKG